MNDYSLEPGSFRDRNGRVFYGPDAVYRSLSPHAFAQWELLSSSKLYKKFSETGNLVPTELVPLENGHLPDDIAGEHNTFLKHQRVPFVSYPYEWCFSMLKDAATLQLELLSGALDEDMILKDSSAFNFQWEGVNPVFIDIPSFEKLQQGEPWIGYRQFCQLFLYPLFMQAYKEIPFHSWLRGNIDGIEPEQCNQMMSMRDLIRPGVFNHVLLHSKIQNRYAATTKDVKKELNNAGFSRTLIKNNVRQLLKIVKKLKWGRSQSEWSAYTETHSYDAEDFEQKKAFVHNVVHSKAAWELVWDLGCNTGTFSKIASENADYVISMDADHLAIEKFYAELKGDDRNNILPLVMNINMPSPNQGWRGMERKSLEMRGTPDLTLCLALIHHLVISANIPLKEFVGWLSSLNTSLIIEFVTKEDPMVETLLRNKEDQYSDYNPPHFESCLSAEFDVLEKKTLSSGTRILYDARRKA